MTPEQLRAARSWLGWSQVELAKRANVSERTVQTFEGGKVPHANSVAAMRAAIESAGILCLFGEAGEAAGIARLDVGGDATALVFERRGEKAGVVRPLRRHRFI